LAVQGHQFILDSTGNDTFGLHVASTQTSQSFGYSVSKVTGQGDQTLVSGLTGHDILVYDSTIQNIGSSIRVGNGTAYGNNTAIDFQNNSTKDSSFQVGIRGTVLGNHGDTLGSKTGMDLNVLGTTETNKGISLYVLDGSDSNIGIEPQIFGSTGDGWGSKITNSNAPTGPYTQYGEQIDVNGIVDSSSGNKYGVKVTVSNDAKNNYGVWINSDGASTNNYSILTEKGSAVFNDLANAGSDFQVKGAIDSNLLFVDASVDHVGIGTNSPTRKFHVNGDYTFVHNPKNELTSTVSGYGDIVTFGGGSLTAGNLYYLDSLGGWSVTDANSTSSSTGMLAFALGTSASDGMLVRGYIRNSGFTTNTGNIVYVSTTAGEVTTTAPSGSGDIVRIIGYSIDGTNEIIYFNPDNTWVEI
jgi:hypothetical protein